jgi:hypothetical protein
LWLEAVRVRRVLLAHTVAGRHGRRWGVGYARGMRRRWEKQTAPTTRRRHRLALLYALSAGLDDWDHTFPFGSEGCVSDLPPRSGLKAQTSSYWRHFALPLPGSSMRTYPRSGGGQQNSSKAAACGRGGGRPCSALARRWQSKSKKDAGWWSRILGASLRAAAASTCPELHSDPGGITGVSHLELQSDITLHLAARSEYCWAARPYRPPLPTLTLRAVVPMRCQRLTQRPAILLAASASCLIVSPLQRRLIAN